MILERGVWSNGMGTSGIVYQEIGNNWTKNECNKRQIKNKKTLIFKSI